MFFKKLGQEPPLVTARSVYEESYFADGFLYLKYAKDSKPDVSLLKISQEEFEANKPAIEQPETKESQPTDLEILMQAQTDSELRDLEIQQGQELLAQQMADIELAVLGGAV